MEKKSMKFTPKPREEAAKDIRKIYARFFELRKNIKNKGVTTQ